MEKLNPGIEPEIQVSKTCVITISLIEHYKIILTKAFLLDYFSCNHKYNFTT